ncbi:hypothetical protein SLS56_004186 [Neofusicoccum ribis]|uniref:Aminotransferase-like plant mobile domain-containing protein n=1 Tax=Neofusicoccum ribis TaxID=45134 RepID=A0ABR3SWV8_9PEZI
MVQLKYEKYVINAGDLGAFILRYQAASYPSNVVSTICNFWVIEPNATDWARFASGQTTDDESYYMQSIHAYETQLSGYRFTYQSLPLSIAYAMTDSPLGFAMWIYNLMDKAIDHSLHIWSPEEIITWALMYLIQGPYGGFRFYKESAADGALVEFGFGTMPFVKQPTAISLFPFDIWYRLPLDWAQRQGNVKARYLHDRGGHFAAYEVPELRIQCIDVSSRHIMNMNGSPDVGDLCFDAEQRTHDVSIRPFGNFFLRGVQLIRPNDDTGFRNDRDHGVIKLPVKILSPMDFMYSGDNMVATEEEISHTYRTRKRRRDMNDSACSVKSSLECARCKEISDNDSLQICQESIDRFDPSELFRLLSSSDYRPYTITSSKRLDKSAKAHMARNTSNL